MDQALSLKARIVDVPIALNGQGSQTFQVRELTAREVFALEGAKGGDLGLYLAAAALRFRPFDELAELEPDVEELRGWPAGVAVRIAQAARELTELPDDLPGK